MDPKTLSRLILNSVTTADNSAFDVIRVGMVVSGLAIVGLSAWSVVVNHQPFDALSTGGGLAAVFFGGGAGIASKSKDESSLIV